MINIHLEKARQLAEDQLKFDISHATLNDEALAVCPVSHSDDVHMNEIIEVLQSNSAPIGMLKRFTLNCGQCGLCQHASPDGIRFDLMVRILKKRITDLPKQYTNATDHIGQETSMYHKLKRSSHYLLNKQKLGEIAQHIDKIPPKSDELFYAGEHIFNDFIQKQWIATRSKAHIMGGFHLASGYDYLIQGRMQQAYKQLSFLHSIIQKVQPKTIITPTLATYTMMQLLKQIYRLEYTILSLPQWFKKQHIQLVNTPEKIAVYHNLLLLKETGCNLKDIIGEQCHVIDIDEQHLIPTMEYNYGVDKHNQTLRHNIIAAAKKETSILVVDCANTANLLKKATTRHNALQVMDIATFMQQYGDQDV